jgi:Sec-independent protein translocase protein TatA
LLSPIDVAVIGVAALLLFGPDQLPKVARKVGSVVRDLQNTSQTFIREMERAGEIDNPFSPSAWTGQDSPAAESASRDDGFRDPVVHERVEPRSAPEPFAHDRAAHAAAYEPATRLDAAEPFANEPAVKKQPRKSAKKPTAGAPPVAGPVAGEPAASGPVLRKTAPAESLFDDLPAQAPVAKKPVANEPGARKPAARKPAAKKPAAK